MESALGGLHHGAFRASNITLRQALAAGYGLAQRRIIGPDWLDSDRFDFLEKATEGVSDTEVEPLLQALLNERFHLAAHVERREMPVYNLVVAKGGVKMPVYPARDPARKESNPRGVATMRGTVTTAKIAEILSNAAGRPVLDETGLQERFDFVLNYLPFATQVAGTAPEFAPPDLFTAVQQQLGLRLDPGKASIDVIVVDHMERTPSDN